MIITLPDPYSNISLQRQTLLRLLRHVARIRTNLHEIDDVIVCHTNCRFEANVEMISNYLKENCFALEWSEKEKRNFKCDMIRRHLNVLVDVENKVKSLKLIYFWILNQRFIIEFTVSELDRHQVIKNGNF